MDLSVIIISWNVRERLKENLESLLASEGISFEVFVVDNNSSDGSADMVARSFPQVKLVANNKNVGFARANNQAISSAKGEFILLLNPDMRVFPNTLVNMISWMRSHKEADVVSCHLVDKTGETVKHVRRFPGLGDQLAVTLKLPHIFPSTLNSYIVKDFDYNKEARVDSVRGSFFMVKGETMKELGGLDERYFVWFEEVDFCKQVKKTGGEVWYTPAAKCVDYIGQSFSQIGRGQAQKYFRDSMLKYFKKWHPSWQYWILKIAWPFGIFLAKIGNIKK